MFLTLSQYNCPLKVRLSQHAQIQIGLWLLEPALRGHLHQLDVPDHDVRRPVRHPDVTELEDRPGDPSGQDPEEEDDHVRKLEEDWAEYGFRKSLCWTIKKSTENQSGPVLTITAQSQRYCPIKPLAKPEELWSSGYSGCLQNKWPRVQSQLILNVFTFLR